MKISKFTGGQVQTNGYLLQGASGNFVVDAPLGIFEWIEEKGVRVDELYLTHQHYDHVEDVAKFQAAGVPIAACSAYSKDLTLEVFGETWGIPQIETFTVDRILASGNQDMFGEEAEVRHVPGHSVDSLTFYLPSAKSVFVGDALFAGSIGRCDLPNGSMHQLVEGIKQKLLILPEDTRVFSGHGPDTTIGSEKSSNEFLG